MTEQEGPDIFNIIEVEVRWDKSTVIYETSNEVFVQNPGAVCEYFIEELGATRVDGVKSVVPYGERFTIEWDHSKTSSRPMMHALESSDN